MPLSAPVRALHPMRGGWCFGLLPWSPPAPRTAVWQRGHCMGRRGARQTIEYCVFVLGCVPGEHAVVEVVPLSWHATWRPGAHSGATRGGSTAERGPPRHDARRAAATTDSCSPDDPKPPLTGMVVCAAGVSAALQAAAAQCLTAAPVWCCAQHAAQTEHLSWNRLQGGSGRFQGGV